MFLMCYGRAENNAAAIRMIEMTLEAMAKGGICDHIGGGFSRYSTDDQWLVPHFEKMLYDNALLLWAYAEAYRLTEKSVYRDVARDTADYMLRELWGEGFYCGQDADSDALRGNIMFLFPGRSSPFWVKKMERNFVIYII